MHATTATAVADLAACSDVVDGVHWRPDDPWSLGLVALALLLATPLLRRMRRPLRALLLGAAGGALAFGVSGAVVIVAAAVFFGVALGLAPVIEARWVRRFGRPWARGRGSDAG